MIEILKQCKVDGISVRLPDTQLSRSDYMKLEKTLIKACGKKQRGKDFRFDFPTDAQAIIDQLCGGVKIDIKKEFQFFETPKGLAKKMVEMANIQLTDTVLEPSAGQGAIAELIRDCKFLHCYELNEMNNKILHDKGFNVIGMDFLNPDNSNTSQQFQYDKIVANPPFRANQDISHIKEMYNCLKDGGRIVTIMSNHWRTSTNKKELEFKEWLENLDYSIDEVPAETFKESGTNIACCLIVINK